MLPPGDLSIPMVAYDFGVGQFFSGAIGQLYPGDDRLKAVGESVAKSLEYYYNNGYLFMDEYRSRVTAELA